MHAKKFKRLFAMMLAIVTIVSCLAFSASAATSTTKDEGETLIGTSYISTFVPGYYKEWITTGTVNGTLTSTNLVGRNNTYRTYYAIAKNSKAVTKIIATCQVVNNLTGATLDTVTKTANNSKEVMVEKWVATTNNIKLTNFTATETRATYSYVEYITNIY